MTDDDDLKDLKKVYKKRRFYCGATILPSNRSVGNVVEEGLVLVMLDHLLQRQVIPGLRGRTKSK